MTPGDQRVEPRRGPAGAEARAQVCRRGRLLSTLCFRLLARWQQSALLPNSARRALLRTAGLDMDSTAAVASGCFVGGPRVTLGRHTFLNVGVFLDGSGPITIGDYSRIGPMVRIVTSTHRVRASNVRRWPADPTLGLPVVVGRGCWVGTGATLLPGVTVADGCIIGAGAVVLRNTKPNGLYAGVPAVRVKDLPVDELFDEDLLLL